MKLIEELSAKFVKRATTKIKDPKIQKKYILANQFLNAKISSLNRGDKSLANESGNKYHGTMNYIRQRIPSEVSKLTRNANRPRIYDGLLDPHRFMSDEFLSKLEKAREARGY